MSPKFKFKADPDLTTFKKLSNLKPMPIWQLSKSCQI